MARHTVTFDEIQTWANKEAWHLAAASSGHGSLKKLEMSNAGLWRVTCHDKITYEGGSPHAAIAAYNEAE